MPCSFDLPFLTVSCSSILRFTMLAAVLCMSANLARAELSLDELRAKFETAWEREKLEKGTKVLKLRDGYVGALERLKNTLGKEEKLKQATQVLAEIEAAKTGAALEPFPENADYRLKSLRSKWDRETELINDGYKADIRKLANTYLKALEESKRSLTRAGKIKEAVVVGEEMERMRQIPEIVDAFGEADVKRGPTRLRGKRGEGNLALATKGAKARAEKDPDKLIDGKVEDYRWIGGYSFGMAPCEFGIELGTLYVIDRIRLLLWDIDERRHNYVIEVSADNKTWDLVADFRKRTADTGWQEAKFEARDVRYIRIKGLGLSDNTLSTRFIVVEVEAFSPE